MRVNCLAQDPREGGGGGGGGGGVLPEKLVGGVQPTCTSQNPYPI